jgi:hypothetical protein
VLHSTLLTRAILLISKDQRCIESVNAESQALLLSCLPPCSGSRAWPVARGREIKGLRPPATTASSPSAPRSWVIGRKHWLQRTWGRGRSKRSWPPAETAEEWPYRDGESGHARVEPFPTIPFSLDLHKYESEFAHA